MKILALETSAKAVSAAVSKDGKILAALTDATQPKITADKNGQIGIAHADDEEGTAYLIEKLREKGFAGECLTVCYEPVTGSHVGPGTVALFFFGTDRMG